MKQNRKHEQGRLEEQEGLRLELTVATAVPTVLTRSESGVATCRVVRTVPENFQKLAGKLRERRARRPSPRAARPRATRDASLSRLGNSRLLLYYVLYTITTKNDAV